MVAIYKINFSERDSIKTSLLYRYGNTRNFFDCCKGSYYCNGKKIIEYETIEESELIDRIEEGKTALFPISKCTDTFNICNTAKLGIIPIMTNNKTYNFIKELYLKEKINCTADSKVIEQKELFEV